MMKIIDLQIQEPQQTPSTRNMGGKKNPHQGTS